MANENKNDSVSFMDKETLKNFFLSGWTRKNEKLQTSIENAIESSYDDIQMDNMSQLENLLANCKMFEQIYNEILKVSYKDQTFSISSNSKTRELLFKKAFTLGFQIMYKTRKFLLGEDIKLRIMVSKEYQENGQTFEYGLVEVDIDDILDFEENFKVYRKNNRINLNDFSKLKTSENNKSIELEMTNIQKSFIRKWEQCLELSGYGTNDFKIKNGKKDYYIDSGKNQKIPRARHTKPSYNVVKTTDDDGGNIKYYYVLNTSVTSPVTNFNRGFLFEWFDAYIDSRFPNLRNFTGEDSEERAEKDFINTNFKVHDFDNIFKEFEKDWIPGHLQGDYWSKNLNQWVQNKYGDGERIAQLSAIKNFILGTKTVFKTKSEKDNKGTEASHGLLNILNRYHQAVKEKTQEQEKDNFVKALTTLCVYTEGNPHYRAKGKKQAETIAENYRKKEGKNEKNELLNSVKEGTVDYLSDAFQEDIKTTIFGEK